MLRLSDDAELAKVQIVRTGENKVSPKSCLAPEAPNSRQPADSVAEINVSISLTDHCR